METPMIYKQINACMADIGFVGKNQKNQQQGFMFRGIDAVMNAIAPALIKNKIFIVPEILDQQREERQTARGGNLIYSICKIRYRFYAEDGSFIETTVIGEGMDSGDKATNKAMSIAFKYACFQVFCVPTEEMKDPDEECHEVTKDRKKPEQAKTVISQTKADAMKQFLVEHDIKEETIFKLYNVKSIESLTENQHANIIKNVERILNAQNGGNK